MNPHNTQPISPFALVSSLWRNRGLITQMTQREVLGRYKGSVMGLAWSFFNPILMLSVYTFVFSVVFKSRWGMTGNESKTQFAVVLFVGMIIHGLFAEVLNRAPSLILSNTNYVKKVVFPLEILPWVSMGSTLFHALVSLIVLLLMLLVVHSSLNWTMVFFPLVLSPVILLTIGISWFLASLGVFLRDVGQFVGILVTAVLFMSAIFYPPSALPESVRSYVLLNPLAFAVEQTRTVVIRGGVPDWWRLTAYLAASVVVAWFGFVWFQKTRSGFADVL